MCHHYCRCCSALHFVLRLPTECQLSELLVPLGLCRLLTDVLLSCANHSNIFAISIGPSAIFWRVWHRGSLGCEKGSFLIYMAGLFQFRKFRLYRNATCPQSDGVQAEAAPGHHWIVAPTNWVPNAGLLDDSGATWKPPCRVLNKLIVINEYFL